jgi:hypothetical protein
LYKTNEENKLNLEKKEQRDVVMEGGRTNEELSRRPLVSTFLDRPFFSNLVNWPLSIWEEFRPLEVEIDRRFKDFELEMNKTR